MNPTLLVIAALGLLLAVSAAGNAYQYHEHSKDQVEIGTTRQLATDTKAAAMACTTGVDNLEKAGRTRQSSLLEAMTRIAPDVKKGQEDSIKALGAKPDNPQDLCGSIERYLRGELKKQGAR